MTMMRRHGQAQFTNGVFPVSQEPLTECRVRPGFGDNPGAIPWDPFLFGRVGHRFDKRLGLHSPRFEYRFDSGDPALDRRDLRGTRMTGVHD
jgi:hypothetical protein